MLILYKQRILDLQFGDVSIYFIMCSWPQYLQHFLHKSKSQHLTQVNLEPSIGVELLQRLQQYPQWMFQNQFFLSKIVSFSNLEIFEFQDSLDGFQIFYFYCGVYDQTTPSLYQTINEKKLIKAQSFLIFYVPRHSAHDRDLFFMQYGHEKLLFPSLFKPLALSFSLLISVFLDKKEELLVVEAIVFFVLSKEFLFGVYFLVSNIEKEVFQTMTNELLTKSQLSCNPLLFQFQYFELFRSEVELLSLFSS